MSSFKAFSVDSLNKLQEKLKTSFASCTFYEHTAQKFAEALYNEFNPSVVLSRVYVTIPYGQLPTFNKTFVSNLANAKGVSGLIKDTTPILSLVGTAGKNPIWWDRKKSQGHIGIPLCSAAFIDAIPMMSRLLQELGLNLAWFDKQDLSIVKKSMTGLSGLFYVENASQGIDAKGRKIIPAQDFVATHNIRTVFGMGTIYVTGAFAVSIVFTNEMITREQLKPLMALIYDYKNGTSKLATSTTWLKT